MTPKHVDWTVAVWPLLVWNDVVQSLKSAFKQTATVKIMERLEQAHTATRTLPGLEQLRPLQHTIFLDILLQAIALPRSLTSEWVSHQRAAM